MVLIRQTGLHLLLLSLMYYQELSQRIWLLRKLPTLPWLWDAKQGQNGYMLNQVHGLVCHSSGQLLLNVPTLDGYTAAKVTDTSGKLANQFIFPNLKNNSDKGHLIINKESLAYLRERPNL